MSILDLATPLENLRIGHYPLDPIFGVLYKTSTGEEIRLEQIVAYAQRPIFTTIIVSCLACWQISWR